MSTPPSVIVWSWSLDSWCSVPSQMLGVLSGFNFNRLAHIHYCQYCPHMWPASALYCLLPSGQHRNIAECRQHMSTLWVHVVVQLRWRQHSKRGKGQDRARFLAAHHRSIAIWSTAPHRCWLTVSGYAKRTRSIDLGVLLWTRVTVDSRVQC